MLTRQTPHDTGFVQDSKGWKGTATVLSEARLNILSRPVIQDWDTPYRRQLAEIATSGGGTILQIGFGLGISAHFVDEHDIDEHIIVEADAEAFQRLQQFSKYARTEVEPLFGLWQEFIDAIPSESIDGILFDTYSMHVDEIHDNRCSFFQHAYRVLKSGGILTYYSDESLRISPQNAAALRAAGFSTIRYSICCINPPKDCVYWQSNTVVAPRITKPV